MTAGGCRCSRPSAFEHEPASHRGATTRSRRDQSPRPSTDVPILIGGNGERAHAGAGHATPTRATSRGRSGGVRRKLGSRAPLTRPPTCRDHQDRLRARIDRRAELPAARREHALVWDGRERSNLCDRGTPEQVCESVQTSLMRPRRPSSSTCRTRPSQAVALAGETSAPRREGPPTPGVTHDRPRVAHRVHDQPRSDPCPKIVVVANVRATPAEAELESHSQRRLPHHREGTMPARLHRSSRPAEL